MRARLSHFSHVSLRPHGLQPTRLLSMGILQARIPEWVAMPSARRSSQPRDQIHASYVSCVDRQVLYHQATREALPSFSYLERKLGRDGVRIPCLNFSSELYQLHDLDQTISVLWASVSSSVKQK